MRFAWQSLGLLRPKQRIHLYLYVVTLTLLNLLDISAIALVGFLVSAASSLVTGSQTVTIAGVSWQLPTQAGYFWLLIAVAALFVSKAVLGYSVSRALSNYLAGIDDEMSATVANYITTRPIAEIRNYSPAQLEWVIVEGTSRVFSQSLFALASIYSNAALLVFVFTIFAVVDLGLALAILGYLAVFIVGFELLVRKRQRLAGAQLQKGTRRSKEAVADLLGTFRELKVFGRQSYSVNQLVQYRKEVSQSFATQRAIGSAPRYFVETGLIVGIIILLAWQLLIGTGASSIAVTAILLAGGVRMMGAVIPIQNYLGMLRVNSATAVENIALVRQAFTQVQTSSVQVQTSSVQVADLATHTGPIPVRFDRVCLRYSGADRDAVHNLSCVIPAGHQVALIGRSGSGKTTTVDLLLGLLTPTSGVVEVGGVKAAQALEAPHPQMAYVPQRPVLVQGTLRENIALGIAPHQISETRLHEVIAFAGLAEMVNALPDGVDTVMSLGLSQFSGGEIQRISLARALYQPPQLLVLDEATSALDAHTESIITEGIERLRGEVTVIIVAHRLSTVQRADSLIYLEDGVLRGQGPLDQLRRELPEVERLISLMAIAEESTD